MTRLLILCFCSSLAVADDLVVVSDVDNCLPCRRLRDDLGRHPEAVAGHRVIWADGRAANWQVRQVPTIIRVRDGREVDRQVGYRGLPQLTRWLRP